MILKDENKTQKKIDFEVEKQFYETKYNLSQYKT
jgi:hypothetical protein